MLLYPASASTFHRLFLSFQDYLENFMLYVSLTCCLYALLLIVAATLAFVFAAQINR